MDERVRNEFSFDPAAATEAGSIFGCRDEFGTRKVEITFTGTFLRSTETSSQFKFGFEKIPSLAKV
jgi:hypothetical protein